MRLRARNRGDIDSAMISAGYYAKKLGRPMFVYSGNSYGHAVWRVTWKTSEYLSPINNTGGVVYQVSPSLDIFKHSVIRPGSPMHSNAARKPRPKKPNLPKSITIPDWMVKKVQQYTKHNSGSLYDALHDVDDMNQRLRDDRYGVRAVNVGLHPYEPHIQIALTTDARVLLREPSGEIELPLVASFYTTVGRRSQHFEVPVDNVRLYMKWEPGDQPSETPWRPLSRKGFWIVSTLAESRPDLDTMMRELQAHLRKQWGRNPAPPPPRRPPPPYPGGRALPPPRGPATSVLSSLRHMSDEHNQPFDPERQYPRETKRHHFAVNGFNLRPNASRTPSQQYADYLVQWLMDDDDVLLEVYDEPPDPRTSIRAHLYSRAREGLGMRKSDIGSPSEVVCYVGQSAINMKSVQREIDVQLGRLVAKGKRLFSRHQD